jgi:hypothetical protein
MENNVWMLGEITDHMGGGVLVSETPHCGSAVVYQNSVVVTQCGFGPQFQKVMLLATTSPVADIKMASRRINGGGRIVKP